MIGMLLITTLSLILVSFFTYDYFTKRFESQSLINAEYTLDVAGKSFNNKFNSILSNTSRLLSTIDINIIQDIESNNESQYIYNYITLDDSFTAFIHSNDYICGAFMIDKNKHFYSTSSVGLKYDSTDFFDMENKAIHGITFFPVTKSPFSLNVDVIPMVFPIKYEERMNSIFVIDTSEDISFHLILLLDATVINQYLSHINNNLDSTIYLATKDYMPLNLPGDSEFYGIATSEDIRYGLEHYTKDKTFVKTFNGNTYLIKKTDVGLQGLQLISIILKDALFSETKDINTFILISWLISSVLAGLLAYFLSNFITKPIKSLVSIVRTIQEGRYTKKITPIYNDEIGLLNTSINSMYDTIQLQIQIIKEDAKAQSKAEIDILTNQINPHFLYNTLSSIHFEILNQHTYEAASMIESLGQFLRIGLNSGITIIPISKEVKHVQEYINLMNHLSNLNIHFECTIQAGLSHHPILKFILQPLFENAIKHGFQKDGITQIGLTPIIRLTIEQRNHHLHIDVSDNGVGMDIDKTKKALYENPSLKKDGHIGLSNVYRRLIVYYNNQVDIDFLSIPFYQNSVIITIPFE